MECKIEESGLAHLNLGQKYGPHILGKSLEQPWPLPRPSYDCLGVSKLGIALAAPKAAQDLACKLDDEVKQQGAQDKSQGPEYLNSGDESCHGGTTLYGT